MALKVLHIHFGKEGGAERFFVNLATAFAEAGVEQRFVTRPGRSWAGAVAPLGPVILNNYRRLSLSAPILTWRVHRMIRLWQPQAVMAWMPRAARLIPDDPGPVKLVRLGDYPKHLRHFQRCDLIVPNTPGIAERCRNLGWERPVEVVSNFPRPVAPEPVDRAALGIPEDAFLVASSGRMVHRKGFDVLIDALAALPGAYGLILGDGEKRPELEAQIARLGLKARVKLAGWVDEPIHYVAAADAFVMASRHEPLGNVVLEAWQARTACVTTASEGPSWFATDRKDARVVPIDDVDAMAAALAEIRDRPNFAAHLVEGGSHTLAAQFSKEAVVKRYLEIFEGGAG
ncbi:MAG: glycosyltransferase [Pseudomonadota bacterium]